MEKKTEKPRHSFIEIEGIDLDKERPRHNFTGVERGEIPEIKFPSVYRRYR